MPAAAYTTPLDAIAPPSWTKIGDIWLTTQPFIDTSTGGYARLSYGQALEYLPSIGAELPSAADLDALRDAAVAAGANLVPVTLPTHAMMAAAHVSEAQVNAYRNANMMSTAWCQAHDAEVATMLASLGRAIGDGLLAANIGKHWIAGATPGWARLKGWWDASRKRWIQDGVYPVYPHGEHEFHSSDYSDYSSTIVAKRTTEPS